MIQPQTRVVMWAQQFRRPAQDVFGLHEQVRAALIGALRPASAEARRVPAHVPDSRAYRLYLEGQYFLQNRQRDLALAQKAADDFRKAIEADPQYADPYVGLAECTDILSGMPNTSYEQLHAEQREAAAQALRLDPDSPAALAAQASIFQHLDYNWTLAEQYLRRAVKMQPGNARLHQLYAGLLSDIGKQDEALAEFQQALDLDPDSPSTVVAREICLYRARRYADAKAQIEATLRKEPALFRLYSYLAAIYLQQGDCSAALENYRKAVDLAKGDPLSLAHEAYGLASCRDTDKAKQIVNALQRGNGNFFYIACALGAMRDYDAAFATLDKAVAEHDNDLTLLRVHPYADNLRRDPRVHKYLKIVHLE
jgi:Tfp pilus assembly protein PilF